MAYLFECILKHTVLKGRATEFRSLTPFREERNADPNPTIRPVFSIALEPNQAKANSIVDKGTGPKARMS